MAQHIQFTMILFFINIMITFLFPQYTFIQNNIYNENSLGETSYNDNFTSAVSGGLDDNTNKAVSSFGLIDVFFMVIDFIKYILNFFIALPILIMKLPLVSAVKILFFFPVVLLYSFAIIGWIRRG